MMLFYRNKLKCNRNNNNNNSHNNSKIFKNNNLLVNKINNNNSNKNSLKIMKLIVIFNKFKKKCRKFQIRIFRIKINNK